MLSIAQLKPGVKFIFQDEPYEILAANHLKLGRGGGIQQVKMRHLKNGQILHHNFKGNERLKEAEISNQTLQYLYADERIVYFMTEDFEQLAVDKALLAEKMPFLIEGEKVSGKFFADQLIDLELPIKMIFSVKHAEPGLRGDRQTAGTKPVVLENNTVIQAPLFIKTGDRIVVDTRSGTYIERTK